MNEMEYLVHFNKILRGFDKDETLYTFILPFVPMKEMAIEMEFQGEMIRLVFHEVTWKIETGSKGHFHIRGSLIKI